MSRHKDRIAAVVATVAVLAVLALGYKMLGPHQREISADMRRVDDLRALSNRLYRPNPQPLPANISEIERTGAPYPRDPVTHLPYEYIPGSGTIYQLCATFTFASKDEYDPAPQPPFYWDHPQGRHCFQLDSAKWN